MELETSFNDKIEVQGEKVIGNNKGFDISSCKFVSTATTARTAVAAKAKLGAKTPIIPLEVYRNLPEFLSKVVEVFDVEREKDIVLTSALVLLSACFSNITGIYDRRIIHANLYCFIIAPAASGKGVMNFARQLVERIHQLIIETYEKTFRIGGDISQIKRTHFIPADSSSAAVKRNLAKNNEMGTICETEADTLSATLLQDWGGYSDLLRKGFQHEPVTYSRIGRDEDIILHEIKNPKLSVCLSGTPGQVSALLKSTEDGLFSRFIFYTFRNNGIPSFKDVFNDGGIKNLPEYFEKLSDQVEKYSKKVQSFGAITFNLKPDQRITFRQIFDKNLKRLHLKFGEETKSTVNRLGLITFRIAMILSLIRKLDQGELTADIECEEIDFETSILLSEIYLEHAMELFQELERKPRINKTAELLLDFLPVEFSNSDAVKIGKESGEISERSVNNHLSELKTLGIITQPKERGLYYKVDLQ